MFTLLKYLNETPKLGCVPYVMSHACLSTEVWVLGASVPRGWNLCDDIIIIPIIDVSMSHSPSLRQDQTVCRLRSTLELLKNMMHIKYTLTHTPDQRVCDFMIN